MKAGANFVQTEEFLGKLILGTRANTENAQYQPVYSIRDFVIWWHKVAGSDDASVLLCYSGKKCGQ